LIDPWSVEDDLTNVYRDVGLFGAAKKRLRPLYYELKGRELVTPIELQARRKKVMDQTVLSPFHYKKGDRLPFENSAFSFIFSEHFFEHLFLDEASELFKECYRVLQPGGCMRTVVPDADLRTYEPPEPVGFTTGGTAWTDPGKHKTRWSIYSLTYCLGEIGFKSKGIVYCDKEGNYHKNLPGKGDCLYAGCVEDRMIYDFRYVQRLDNSLMVDSVKPR
jgi:predicted SAM-dependent methyltransferase